MIRRREFIAGLGAAAWPLAARGQQPAMRVVGILCSATAEGYRSRLTAFRQSLNEGGYYEGRNVAIELRFAENKYDRLPALARDLVQRRVAVIVAIGAINAGLAAKAATRDIPIVSAGGSDPVQLGLVSNVARPDGNVTAVTSLNRGLMAKHLEILRELLPDATAVGLLVNPNNVNTDPIVRELRELSQSRGPDLHVVAVSTESNLDSAIANLVQTGARSFMCATDALFTDSANRLGPVLS
jgi:putative tryptophan/tyrosine transport system substrate-binding protein